MNDSPTRQLSVGVWAIIISTLILSLAAIMLHITKVLDHFEDHSSRYGVDVNWLQNQLNAIRAELSKLQADIATSNSFSQLKKSVVAPGVAPAGITPLKPQAASPAEVNQGNRELKLAYIALALELEGRFAVEEIMATVNENELQRLNSLLFSQIKQYEVIDTTLPTPEKATIKVKVTSNQESPGTGETKETTKTVHMEAVKEGRWWKVADDAESQSSQKAILTKLKEQVKQVRVLQQQLQEEKIKTTEEFQKAWDALPLNKK